ncbi:hypothetical protein ACEQ8H_002342 [Pleosporales sp. CAS-2024a]
MARLVKGFRRKLSIPKLRLHKRCDKPPFENDRLPEVPERFGSPDQMASPVIDAACPEEDTIYSPAIRSAYTLTFLEASHEPQEFENLTNARIQLLQQLVHLDGAAIVSATELEQQLRGTLQSLDRRHGQREDLDDEYDATQVWQTYRRLGAAEKQVLKVSENEKESASSPDESSTDTTTCTRLLTNPEQLPQPRHEVLRRLAVSECSRSLYLTRPEIARRGSANGFHIASLIMSDVSDNRFVLPFLHHIKLHEVRSLKQWLVDQNLVSQSGSISRTEKVLHCIQLLQTGMRYESIAVVFSRTPRQVMESCHEVMRGLERLYDKTVDGLGDAETDEKRWGIARRYEIGQLSKVERYYGFKREEMQRVLVAVDAYTGRRRRVSTSSVESTVLEWGSYLDPKDDGRPSIVAEESGEDSDDQSSHVVGLEMEEPNKRMSSGSCTLTSIDTSSSSLYEEPVVQAAIAQPVWYRKL